MESQTTRDGTSEPKSESENRTRGSPRGKLPINEVGLLSYILMSWMSGLILGIFRNRHRSLLQDELWDCSEEEGIRLNTKRIQGLWNEELVRNRDNASFYNVWIRFTLARSLFGLFLLCINVVTTFAIAGLLLNKIISYLESDSTNLGYGIGLVIAVSACEIIRALTINDMSIYCSQTGTRFRSGMMGAVYEKVLKMKTMHGLTNSEILNVFSIDSQRAYMATCSSIFILTLPLYILIGSVYCYILIGNWGFLAIGTLVVCYIFQAQMAKHIGPIRMESVKYADERVRRTREVINNMKFIKMYAWEKPFADGIKSVRKSERKCLEQSAILMGIINSIVPIIPTLAAVVTITAYAATGNKLTASSVFALIGTMNFLRGMAARIPSALKVYAEAKVSFERIQKLLLMEEYRKPSSTVLNFNNAIEIKDGDFVLEKFSSTENRRHRSQEDPVKSLNDGLLSNTDTDKNFNLSNINFEARKGKLIGISGPVGAGKSLLISAVVGRLELTKGHLAVNGSVAYVPQQAWIFNASVKDNILFGRDFDQERYNNVIRSCCLDTDISMLSNGHDTEIGERGTNLSGGQKQRVSLARAVYSDRDIYILDDPLSALDVKVGKQIFQECILAQLKTKTVLLVTHQLQHLRHCDQVIVMNKGVIVQRGNSEDILKQMGVHAVEFGIVGTNMNFDINDECKDECKASLVETEVNGHVPIASQEKDINKEINALVRAEESAIGNIKFETYKTYISCAGGWCVVSVVIGLFTLASASIMLTEWWLSEWITSRNAIRILYQSPREQKANLSSEMDLPPGQYFNQSYSTLNDTSTSEDNDFFSSISRNTYLIVYVSTLAWVLILQLIKSVQQAKVAVKASDGLHSRCLDSVMKATMSFFDSTPVGRILNRFSKDLDENDALMPQVIYQFLDLFTRFVIAMAISVYVTPWFLMAVVPTLIFFCVLKEISFVSIRELKRFENTSRSPLLSDVNATTTGLYSLVAYEQQEQFLQRCVRVGNIASMSLLLFDIGVRWIAIRLDLMAGCLSVTASLICVLTKGYMLPASAGLILSMCGKTNNTLQFLVMYANQMEAQFTSVERICEYSKDLEHEHPGASKTADVNWPLSGRITFRNVTMRYRKDLTPVLRSVNFEIHPREKVGIVGRTGAGKSSLIVALLRLVELDEGLILIDGDDISKLNLNVIRSKIATITQDPVLFRGSIRYNMDPFNSYSDDDIWTALDKIRMKEKILQYNEGLDVMIEEYGRNLSVGECQLLCLARAVLRNSKILLLDEATANIDTTTDGMIQETIRKCFTECTVITIAHRLNTVLHSDKIIVLEAGQVIEYGSPNELLSDPNSYLSSTHMLIGQ